MLRSSLLATVLLASGAVWSAAMATGSCPGTVQASLVHALPKPLTIALQTSVQDSVNPNLAQQFVNGLQSTGAVIAPQGSVTLNIAVSITQMPSSKPGARNISGTYRGFDWVSGQEVSNDGPSMIGARLVLSVQLTDNTAATLSWVESINCTVQTDDASALANDLGSVVGRTIGQGFDSKPM